MIADCSREALRTPVEKIRALNDTLRRSFVGGRITMIAGVAALSPDLIAQLTAAVQTFEAFDRDNDPYGEHDCGSLLVCGHRIFWKIDYFDRTITRHSPNPADASVTERILTIMLAEEF